MLDQCCDNDYVDKGVKAIDHCHFTGKQRGSAHIDYNINFRLTPVVFYNLRSYDSHFFMREPGKLNLKTNAKPNRLEEYMSFIMTNKF